MAYKVKDIARYMICKTNEMQTPISNLKLQKLLYFAWKDYYKKYRRYLFNENFEAWQFGPVVRNVYYDYCTYGPMPIRSPLYMSYEGDWISAEDTNFLDQFLSEYKNKSVYELVQLTHKPGEAWDKVFRGGIGSWQTIEYALIKADC